MNKGKFVENGEPQLGFDDVLIVPARSAIKSRYREDEVDTTTSIARGLKQVAVGLIPAGMDTVAEVEMATAAALHGGIAEIHRNNTPDQQADEVRKVKDRLRVKEEHPPFVPMDATVGDAIDLLSRRRRGYVVVANGNELNGKFSGLATIRDIEAAQGQYDMPITSVMTPYIANPESSQRYLHTVAPGTTLEEAVKEMHRFRVQKIPIVDSEGNLHGIYTLKDQQLYDEHPRASLDDIGRLMVMAAIGIHEIDKERADKLVDAGVDALVIDIAHGHHDYMEDMLGYLAQQMTRWVKSGYRVPIIAGNFGTAEGVIFAINNGADAVKIGIGPGWVCTTRDVAGAGYPHLSAIMNAREAIDRLQLREEDLVPVIADGGIRKPGDVSKAFAAGADSVMVGSILAGTKQSPGEIVVDENKVPKKLVRGMASKEVMLARKKMGRSTTDNKQPAEGRSRLVPLRGDVSDVLYELEGGLRSGMSYAGQRTIKDYQKNSRFVRLSHAGTGENNRNLD